MKITLGTTYYNNPKLLQSFVDRNLPYVDELIVVDDGSPKYPITDFLQPSNKIRLFRVTEDYGFNSHGCRNLIMKQATNDWVVLIDIDRAFTEPEIAYNIIKTTMLKETILYRFTAFTNPSGIDAHQSVNDFLIHKNHFFKAGGYDEELIGIRTGDRYFFEQLKHFGTEKILYGINLKLLRRSSVRQKQLHKNNDWCSPNDKPMRSSIMKIIKARIKTPEPNKQILTFNWEELKK